MTKKPKITVGLLTYDDFDGVYFTVQSLRLHHSEVMDRVEFVVLDTNPNGPHGHAVEAFLRSVPGARYVLSTCPPGTAYRSLLIEQAKTEYSLVMDCHVLLAPGALASLLTFFDEGKDEGNLLQGPMLTDRLTGRAMTHMEPVWRDSMWGIWADDDRGQSPDAPPFEIPAQGLGLFACRTDSWLRFHPGFRGFGGEECYIHEKYRQAGKKTLCLPFLRWLHRFPRPAGVTYPRTWHDRVRNYLLGHAELGLDPQPVIEHFKGKLPKKEMDALLAETLNAENQATASAKPDSCDR